MASMVANLEAHLTTLDLDDPDARREHEVYAELVNEQREIARGLRATAEHMERQRDLPAGRHDEAALRSPKALEAFETFVKSKRALRDLLEASASEDQELLVRMAVAAQKTGG